MGDVSNLREAVARIAEPNPWEKLDRAAKRRFLGGADLDGPLTTVEHKARLDRDCAPSLAKANAILALLAPALHEQGRRSGLEEACRTVCDGCRDGLEHHRDSHGWVFYRDAAEWDCTASGIRKLLGARRS